VEFLAYRLLYYLYSAAPWDATSLLRALTPAQRRHPAITHAMQLRAAVAVNNYVR
jgi:SAC3 family protein LENG8/THP3